MAQRLVSGVVTVGIVYLFEKIYVAEEQRFFLAALFRLCFETLIIVVECNSVFELCQLVVKRIIEKSIRFKGYSANENSLRQSSSRSKPFSSSLFIAWNTPINSPLQLEIGITMMEFVT